MNYRYFGIDSYQKRSSLLTQSCFHRLGPLGFLSLGNDTIFGNQVYSNADTSCLPKPHHTYVVFRGCGTWSSPCISFRRTLAILGEIQRRQPPFLQSPPSPASSPPTLTLCLQVTLFGQSAGAMAVQNMMLSPHTKDKELFRFPEWWSGWNKSWWSQARELASYTCPDDEKIPNQFKCIRIIWCIKSFHRAAILQSGPILSAFAHSDKHPAFYCR